jgi:tRNA(Ile2)-agmatinylcytidine synthase
VNIEKIYIKSLCEVFEKIENPICPRCNKHMKSRGKEKGYQCVLCKTKSGNPIFKKNTRIIREGFYEVPACARRHLSKPLIRMKVKPKKLYELHH